MMGHVGEFISKHAEVLSLLALAFVVTMRHDLPWPLCRSGILNWCYGWVHDALKTFVSFKSPPPPTK